MMKSFRTFLTEAPFNPKPPSASTETSVGVPNGDYLTSPQTNAINVPNSPAAKGILGFNISPQDLAIVQDKLNTAGVNPADYVTPYAAVNDARSDDNNQQNNAINFRSMLAMFNQLPPESGNPSLAAEIAQTMSVNGFKVDEIYDFMIKEYQKALGGQQIFMNPYQIVNQIQQQKQTQGQADVTKNVNTFDPLADLKKHKLFAPVDYQEIMGDEVGEGGFQGGGFEGTGTDAIYGS